MGLKEQVVKDIIRECIEPLLELKKGFEKQENRVDEITEDSLTEKYPSVNAVINFVKNKLTDFSNSISTVYTKVSEFEIYKKDVKTSFENLEKGVADTYATKTVVDDLKTNTEVTRTATGNAITIESSQAPLQNLKLFGKTEQNGTPTLDAPVPLVSVGDSGSFEVGMYGKDLFNSAEKNFVGGNWQGLGVFAFKKGVKYTISLKATQSFTNNMPCIVIWANNSNVNQKTNYGRTTDKISTLVVEYDKDTQGYIYIQAANGSDSSKHTVGGSFIAQVELGEKATPYEPYINKQTLTMLYNPLRIPVLVDYNYIDENGKKYICDEIDLNKGIFNSRIIKKVLNGSEAYTLSSNGVIKSVLSGVKGNWTNYLALSTHFTYNSTIVNTNEKAGYFAIDGGGGIHLTTDFTTVAEFKTWLQSNNVTVYAVRATPIETPLTETELNAYRHLMTNKGKNTILSEAEAEVDYYINKPNAQAIGNLHSQVNEDYFKLQQAIISLGGN